MKALVIFSRDNEHPLSWLLSRECRHVWCIAEDTNSDCWVSYNWRDGRPLLRFEARAEDYSSHALAAYYTSLGETVIEIEVEPKQRLHPFVMNNCVGMVKSVLGLDTWAVTPAGLRSYLSKDAATIGERHIMSLNLTAPGFGGKTPDPPKPTAPPPRKIDAQQTQERKDARRQAAAATGLSGTNTNVGGTLGVATAGATTAKKVLLG